MNMIKLWSPLGLIFALIALGLPRLSAAPLDPVDPATVFPVKISLVNATSLKLEWQIQPGYYLLKKFRLVSNTPEISLEAPILPEATMQKDSFLGEVAVYRGHLVFEVPIKRQPNAPDSFQFVLSYQGCTEAGDCFPTHEVTQKVAPTATPAVIPPESPFFAKPAVLPPAKTLNAALSPLTRQADGGNGLGGDSAEFMDPEQAFQLSVVTATTEAIALHWQIAPGYYLYRDKLRFTLPDQPAIKLLTPQLPAGKTKADEFFGQMEIYETPFTASIPLQGAKPGNALKLTVGYQGCAEAGICYPPMKKTLEVVLTEASPATQSSKPSVTLAPPLTPAAPVLVAETDPLTHLLGQKNWGQIVLAFFAAGLLLAFTPCVFPMIPILSSIIVGSAHVTPRKAFLLSLVYVLAMALTYTAAGVIAGIAGQNLQAVFQDPWILSGFSLIFVALALSSFGFYELQLPTALQTKMTGLSQKQAGGQWLGVAIMGFLSALIVGPCVAPPLAAALIYIGQSGDAVLGGLALFALSMGMGTPLIAMGTSAGQWLPKAGAWMETTKAVFGVILLGLAIWMLERVLPYAITLTAWALLLIVSAVYLGALEPIAGKSGWFKLWKGLGVFLLGYGLMILWAVLAGGGKFGVLQPLKGLGAGQSQMNPAATTELSWQPIVNRASLDTALAQAKAQNKPVLLDFFASWCVECVRMENTSFVDEAVQRQAKNWVLLKADITDYNAEHQALLKSLQLIGPPATVLFDRQGQERRDLRSVGYLNATELLTRMQALP